MTKKPDARAAVNAAVFALNKAIACAADDGLDVELGITRVPGVWLVGGGRIGETDVIASSRVMRVEMVASAVTGLRRVRKPAREAAGAKT